MTQDDPLGWIALAAIAGGALYYHLRSRRGGANGAAPVPDDQTCSDGNEAGPHMDAEDLDSAPVSDLPKPSQHTSPPPRERKQRRLDAVTVRCEHLDHPPAGSVPTASLQVEWISRDLRALRRLGWGGDDHTNVCRYHNRDGRVALDRIHVLCDSCTEREVINATKSVWSEFGRLANDGWVNYPDNTIACRYCSGARRRPWW